VSIALGKFLPDGLVATIVDGPGEAVVSALGRTTETPELVWSPAMAASLAQQLATLGQELIKEQAGGGADWEMPDSMGKRVSPTGEVILQDGGKVLCVL
jgi:DnaJ family protein C protein 13